MITAIKRITACVLFCVIAIGLIIQLNDVAVSKENNRYYYLEKVIEEADESYEVQIYGACHAYTSFNSQKFTDETGVSSFVFANPSEILPLSYLRMTDRFKTDTPKVALLDIWGLNPYETYIEERSIFESYSPVNLERIPYSEEKAEVIERYSAFKSLEDNFSIAKYKNRFLERTLLKVDFDFSYEETEELSPSLAEEMKLRRENRGFSAKTNIYDVSDYDLIQPVVDDSDVLPYEDDITEYLEKIVALCDEYDVQLILYRAPYIAKENELKRVNWLKGYCSDNGIPFYDMEEEITFDYSSDFQDYYHLNVTGAEKVTDFLSEIILEKLG